jgi:hypothetical protein
MTRIADAQLVAEIHHALDCAMNDTNASVMKLIAVCRPDLSAQGHVEFLIQALNSWEWDPDPESKALISGVLTQMPPAGNA